MAEIHAIANGAWSTPTIWDGGVVPTAEDDVYLDNYIISGEAIAKCVYITGTGHLTGNRLTADAVITTHYLFGIRGAILNGNVIFNGNGYFTYESASGRDRAYTINGNVTIEASQSVTPFGGAYYGGPVVFNGNIINNSSQGIVTYVNSDMQENIFNGNITCNNGSLSAQPYGGGGGKILLNGNCWFIGRMFSSNNITPYVYIGGEFSYDSNTLPFFASTYATSSTARIINRNRLGVGLVNLQYEDAPLPQENAVKAGVRYGVQGEYVGSYTPNYPPESVVLKDYEYGDSDDRKTGTMVQDVNVEVGCVTPEDVRKDVPLVGMGVVGSLVVPSVDDVREGVVFDNGSVGTLIVQGGGDRLRIADFGYYTNAQSDTYIVDLTEQDKPKFAVAEERVLIEMFPNLDLNNIPEKYFDDLFVKYLKYRLIVEYYRTAGINSTFTPSEPTTEIVNYQNVRNEVWLNSANIYLKAWGEKYPNSIKKQRIIL